MDLEQWKKALEQEVRGFMGQNDTKQWEFDPALWPPLYEAGIPPEDALLEVLMSDFNPEQL